ncbi:MAG: PLP-dependent lyase/thiolase [Candidatus Dormibacteria bacterium]
MPEKAPRVTLGEGHTALHDSPALARWAGVERLWLKREDTNPTGSHKDRGAAAQISECLARAAGTAVISSSGNAALAAATYGTAFGVQVVALVSPLTSAARLDLVRAAGGHVVVTEKPINYALRLSRVRGWPDLRPSLSAAALRGFGSLGDELTLELEPATPVFAYASSGTTFAAIGASFAAARRVHPLHPVQAGLVNGLSREFGRLGDGRRSVVGDLGVKLSPRAPEVLGMVRASGGEAWWVGDDDIVAAGEALEAAGHLVARECWAALAGIRLASRSGVHGPVALVLTGRAAGTDAFAGTERGANGPADVPVAATFQEVLAVVDALA